MANPNFLWCRWLVLLAAWPHTVAVCEVTVRPEESSLAIRTPAVEVSSIKPRVRLYVGSAPSVIDWTPDSVAAVTRATENTPLGQADNTVLAWTHPAGFRLQWILSQLQGQPGITLQCELTNTGEEAIRIQRFVLLDAQPGTVQLKGHPADWMAATRYLKYARYYDTIATLQRRGQVTQDNSRTAKYTRTVPFEEDFTLYTDHGRQGLSISAVGDVSFIWTHLHVPEDGTLGLDVTSEMTGVLVEPGQSRRSERVLVQWKNWRDASLDVVTWLRSTFQPRDTKPIFGWCSWYCAGSHVTQEHCQHVVDYVRPRRQRYPFETIQVDEGWQIGRHRWHANGKFDRGMVHLAAEMQTASDMAGVWMSPATPNSQRIVDNQLIHFGASGGTSARSFDESWYPGFRHGRPLNGNLDPSAPTAREYMVGELKRLYDQGYRYFKTDFSLVPDVESGYHDPKKTRFEMQRLLYTVFREGVGDDSYLLACNGGPPRAVLGLADATRIGTDSGQKWAFCYPPSELGKPDDVHGSWFPILQTGCASFYTRLLACDPDVARVDATGNAKYDPRFVGQNKKTTHYLPLESARTWHGVVGLYGGTMMISDLIYEPDYQLDNRLRMVEIMHPVTPDKGWNFGGGTDIFNTQFGFVAQRAWGNWISMVLWNPDHQEKRDLHVDRAPLEQIGSQFHLWSFWDERYLGIRDASYAFTDVPRYHSRLVRLTPVTTEGTPTLIGSNLHLSMGSAEIRSIEASQGKTTVCLEPTAGAIEGQLVFFSAQPLELSEAQGCTAFVMRSAPHVYTVVITARDRNHGQRITLQSSEVEPVLFEDVQRDPVLSKAWQAGTITLIE